jgi:hypothetical protein
MNFSMTERQAALLADVTAALDERPTETASQEQCLDTQLWKRLQASSLFDVPAQAEHAALDAVLLAETLSLRNAMVPYAARALVGSLFPSAGTDPIAIMREGHDVPIRYATFCPLLIIVGQDQARLCQAPEAEPVRSNYVYPLGRFRSLPAAVLAESSATEVMRRWQIALGAEMVGAMHGALDSIVAYLSEREQFNRRLASFQALQHRLAELAVSVETSRWLVRSAAYHDRDDLAAMAAAHVAVAAKRICVEAHQLAGARGYTIAFGLHLWTLRLQALSLEAGGSHAHSMLAAARHWDDTNLPSPAIARKAVA